MTAIGARTRPYVKSLTINGVPVDRPVITHAQIAGGADIVFEMSDKVELWGNDQDILKEFGVENGPGKVEAIVMEGSASSFAKMNESHRDEL